MSWDIHQLNDYTLYTKNLSVSGTLTLDNLDISNINTQEISCANNTKTKYLQINDTATDANLCMNNDGSLNISACDVISNSKFIAKLHTHIIAEYPGASQNPTSIHNAVITNGKLDLTNIESYVRWDATNIDFGSSGTIKLKYTPNYDIDPDETEYLYNIFSFGNGANIAANTIGISHNVNDGQLMMLIYDHDSVIKTYLLGTFESTKGQEYEIEYDFNDSGTHRFFINGMIFNTKSLAIDRIGANYFQLGLYLYSPPAFAFTNGYVRDVVIYSNIQHTDTYVPGYQLTGGINMIDDASYIQADFISAREEIEVHKDLIIGENLYLQTTGSTGTALNYYEDEIAISTPLGGAVADVSLTGKIQRLNNIVTINIDELSSSSVIGATIYTGDEAIPTRFIPSSDTYLPYIVINGGNSTLGTVKISSAGRIIFYVAGDDNFSGSGNVGARGGTITYHI
jgi:hypothetical protein